LYLSCWKYSINDGYLDDDDYDRRSQRRRHEAPLPVRIRKQLLGLAESPLRRWHEEVQSIARLIAENYDDPELQTSFLDLVPQMVLEQPLKTPFVAAVVLLVNTSKPEAIDVILARIASATEERVNQGEWRDVKLYLKFLACLQSCLEGDGLFPVLDELFTRAVVLQTASSDDVSQAILSLPALPV
jgi:nuclear cap-binding protein subunit 1